MVTKESIRKQLRMERMQLSKQQVIKKSSSICQKLIELIEKKDFCQSDWIFVYSATQHEVDLKEFMQYALEHDINIAFPKVHGEFMEFYEVKSLSQLMEGAFHILEPSEECKWIRLNPNQTCTMLVPGVGFSEKGYRIGYGKGYYDRYLAMYPQIYTIGIAYEMQICPDFTLNEFDIAMHKIITEEREIGINDELGRIM